MKNIIARIIVFAAKILTERDKLSRPDPIRRSSSRSHYGGNDYATKARLSYGDDQY